MGQSLTKNFIHIVFSTKYRENLIDEDIEKELFGYLGEICNNKGCYLFRVGGYRNHVHILCNLSRQLALSKLVQELKANSSKWMKTKGEKYKHFRWQNGYSAFSVNPDDLRYVCNYIANQKERHEGIDYKEEFMLLIDRFDVEYDERYVWD